MARFKGVCGYCGLGSARMQIDHVIPIERAHLHRGLDPNDESNLMPSCFSCNNYKNVLCIESFRAHIQDCVRKAREHSMNFRFAERFGLVKVTGEKVVFHFERADRGEV